MYKKASVSYIQFTNVITCYQIDEKKIFFQLNNYVIILMLIEIEIEIEIEIDRYVQ